MSRSAYAIWAATWLRFGPRFETLAICDLRLGTTMNQSPWKRWDCGSTVRLARKPSETDFGGSSRGLGNPRFLTSESLDSGPRAAGNVQLSPKPRSNRRFGNPRKRARKTFRRTHPGIRDRSPNRTPAPPELRAQRKPRPPKDSNRRKIRRFNSESPFQPALAASSKHITDNPARLPAPEIWATMGPKHGRKIESPTI